MGKKEKKRKNLKRGGDFEMRRFMTLVLVGLMIGAFATAGFAALNTTGTIQVQCGRSVGIAVSTSATYSATEAVATISTGMADTGAALYYNDFLFTIWNISPANQAAAQNYSLKATGDAQYLSGTWASVSIDTYAIAGVFCAASQATNPGASAYGAGTDDVICQSETNWTSTTRYSPSAGTAYPSETKHYNTVAGTSDPCLNLWLGLKTPTAVTSDGAASRSFVITVTAK